MGNQESRARRHSDGDVTRLFKGRVVEDSNEKIRRVTSGFDAGRCLVDDFGPHSDAGRVSGRGTR